MRICLVSETWTPEVNGVAHTLAQLSRELVARSHRLELIRPRPLVPGAAEGLAAELQVPGLAVAGLPPGALRLARRASHHPAVARIATPMQSTWRPRDRWAGPPSRPLAASACPWSRAGTPTSTITAGTTACPGWHRWWRPACAPFHNRCAATLVPTRAQADDLRRRGFQGLRCMARGIDGTRFDPGYRDEALRRCWGAGPHTPVALHVGRLAPEKNLELLRDSFQAMRAAHPELRLVIVGDGPSRRYLSAACRRLTSPASSPRAAGSPLRQRRPLPVSLAVGNLGQRAAGGDGQRPGVVAFRHAAGAEVIDDGHNGLSVAAGDEAGFRDAAVALCQHPARWAQLGRAARRRALDYTWPAITDSFLSTLEYAREKRHETARPCRV